MTDINREPYRKISVITPTFNRPRSALNTAISVLADENPNLTYYLVDQDKTGTTEETVRQSGILRDDRFRYIFSEEAGECLARNLGMKLAIKERGRQVLAGIDDDCIASGSWASRYLDKFNSTTTDFHFGAMVKPQGIDGNVPQFRPGRDYVVNIEQQITTGLGMSGNFAITSEVFNRVGHFDELLGCGTRIGAGDDQDYAIRVARAGGVITAGEEPSVLHYGARVGSDDRELRIRYAWGFSALAEKHKLYGDTLLTRKRNRMLKESVLESIRNAAKLQRPSGALTVAGILKGIWIMRDYEPDPNAEPGTRILRRKS